MILLVVMALLTGRDPVLDLIRDIPIVGDIISADSTSASAAKCLPAAADTALIGSLIRRGALSETRCLWFVPVPDERH